MRKAILGLSTFLLISAAAAADTSYRLVIKPDASYEIIINQTYPKNVSIKDIFINGFYNFIPLAI